MFIDIPYIVYDNKKKLKKIISDCIYAGDTINNLIIIHLVSGF